MKKFLQPDSKFSKNAASIGSLAYVVSDAAMFLVDKTVGIPFLFAGSIGVAYDHTKTGVMTHYGISFFTYGAMGVRAVTTGSYGELVTAIGGMVSCGQILKENYKGSWYQQTFSPHMDEPEEKAAAHFIQKNSLYEQNVTPLYYNMKEMAKNLGHGIEAVGKALDSVPLIKNVSRKLGKAFGAVTSLPYDAIRYGIDVCHYYSDNEKWQKFGADMDEISRRDMFKGSTTGIVMDAGYPMNALANGQPLKAGISSLWIVAQSVCAIATPEPTKQGEPAPKHIVRQWYESLRDKMKKLPPQLNGNNPALPLKAKQAL